MSSKLKQLAQQVRELQKKMADEGKEALHAAFREFFEAHPEVRSVVWTQYTPHWNDGDACSFSVNPMELKLHEKAADDDTDWDSPDEDPYGKYFGDDEYSCGEGCASAFLPNDGTSQLVKDYDDLSNSCNDIEDALRLTFGDHVMVVATKDGFDIQDHEHD